MRITYNETADVLTVEDETYEGFDRSIELDGMAVDLAEDDSCLGLQLFNATDRTGLGQEQLQDVDDVEVTVDGEPGQLTVTAKIRHDSGTAEVRASQEAKISGEDV